MASATVDTLKRDKAIFIHSKAQNQRSARSVLSELHIKAHGASPLLPFFQAQATGSKNWRVGDIWELDTKDVMRCRECLLADSSLISFTDSTGAIKTPKASKK